MKNYKLAHAWLMTVALLFSGSHSSAEAQTVQQIPGRIAFSTDGNIAGKGDAVGTPLSIALLHKTQRSSLSKIVYIDYANHYWNGAQGEMYNNYRAALTQAASRYDLNSNILFDVSRNKANATRALVTEINRSTASNPLHVFLNGPADHLCDAVKKSNADARRYVTVYTHGRSDSELRVGGSCNMEDLMKVKPTTVRRVAYDPFSLTSKYSDFTWLRDNPDRNVSWIYDQLAKVNRSEGDIRDAGSVWGLVMQDSNPSIAKFASFFGRNTSTPVEPTNPVEPTRPTPVVSALSTLLADRCYTTAWNPTEQALINDKWSILRATGSTHDTSYDMRASYVANGPENQKALKFVAYKDKRQSLVDYRKTVAASDAARLVFSFYLPKNFQAFSSGRLAAGVQITDPDNRGTGIGGGVLPERQNGSSIRINHTSSKNTNEMTPMLYSYHLDRKSPRVVSEPDWEGKQPKVSMFGEGARLTSPIPKGEWVTMVIDVTLNDVGRNNGSSYLYLFNAAGKLVSESSFKNVIYRNDAKWKIIGPYFTEKFNNPDPTGTGKDESMYTKGYALLTKRPDCR